MPADIETLLAEAPWLARLARSLTGNAAEADDLVQDTYAAALRAPPDTERPVRPWLRGVATNLARMRYRGSTRRAAKESAIQAQSEPVRTPEQLVERAQLERRLADLVLGLAEPFRTTVLLRYREGLSAEQIAKQQGIPAGTVRSRLKTALDRLRDELAESERVQMRALFAAPLAGAMRNTSASALWRIVMAKVTSKVAAVIALALLFVGGAAVVVWQRSSTTPRDRHAVHAATSDPGRPPRELIAQPALFVQARLDARRVRGRVTSDGAAYANALVQLTHADTQVVVGEVHSGADGTFDLGDQPADRYVVAATAPDRAALPVRVDLRMPTTAPVELRLVGCNHLRGTVVDGSGAPIAHARVAREDAPSVFADTDAAGHYDLCTHYGGTTMRYSASGYQSVVITLPVADNSTRDVVLIPEAVVEGTVVDTNDKPVPGAWVVIDPGAIGPEHNGPATGFSAGDGTFRITGVSPGRNLIAGFAPHLRSDHKQELVVGAGEARSGIVVRLAPSATIVGTVVSGDAAVAGVGVGVKIGNHDETGVLAVTQSDGSFVIDRAPRGDVALYVVGHTVVVPRSLHIADQQMHVRVEVQPLGGVRGRVLRGTTPVADAQVSCPFVEHVFTDASGNYSCEGLMNDGPQEIYADVTGGEWGYATANVKRGETVNLDIPLDYSASICGRVVDEHDTPLGGIEVRVAERSTGDFGKDISRADGAFCARILTGGTYTVAVYAGPREVTPTTPPGDVTLGPRDTKQITITVAAPTSSISGLVSDPHGAPAADAIVRLFADERAAARFAASNAPTTLAITDEAGRFTLNKLAPGDYMLVVTARDGSEVRKWPVAAGTRDVAITLAAAGRIEGELVGFTSAPTITGSIPQHPLIDAEVDGQKFRATGLSPGTYVLMALTDSREADTKQVVVRAGETTHVTLTNRGTTTITGVAQDFFTHAPVPGLRCTGFARDGDAMGTIYAGPDEGTLTDAQGAFRFTSPAGEIQVGCGSVAARGSRFLVAERDRTTPVTVLTVVDKRQPNTIDAQFAFTAARITEVTPGGAAERAGLAVGDEVVAVDGRSVVELGSGETMLVITQRPIDTTAKLTILRGGERRTVAVSVRAAQ